MPARKKHTRKPSAGCPACPGAPLVLTTLTDTQDRYLCRCCRREFTFPRSEAARTSVPALEISTR